MHKRTTTVLAAGILVLVGTLTGCSAGDAPSSDSTKASSKVGYEACLRDKGYDYPDQDAQKGLQLHIPQGADKDQFVKDLRECVDKTSDGGPGSVKPMSDAEIAQYEGKVAACVRGEGFPDFPDEGKEREAILKADPSAEKALEKCYREVQEADQKEKGK